MRAAIVVLLGLITAACADSEAMRSPAYQAGFNDGCTTASAESSGAARPPQRDTELAAKDADYRAGWNAGHAVCARSNNPAHY